MDTVRSWEDLLLHYQVDTRSIHLKTPLLSKGRDMPDGTYYDDFGIRWKKAAYYYDAIERPLANVEIYESTNKFFTHLRIGHLSVRKDYITTPTIVGSQTTPC